MFETKISFANFISFFCEKTGADVETVLDAVGIDKRIGRIFMDPGVGFGGSCLPKDVKALTKIGHSLGIDTRFLDAVNAINLESRKNLLNKVLSNSAAKIISVWGLTFKPDTDDIREAPSLFILDELLKNGFTIAVYDPAGIENIKKV